ncbi:glycosyltransferase [Oceanibaculum indicum]|uniref:Beta-monoglucosyldiacylglycerol synthase n=1 Tax=Oceanibaculum indicum P24 TaxID=1207063 RepID=K2JM90_9PROT|nr:glycosyltransferase [Oceanibaculum indicum]EKE76448.1 family 2 glycosyl transferase [Oceanibaculum indicum P24]
MLRLSNLLIVGLVILANVAVWGAIYWPRPAVNADGAIAGMSFSPYRRDQGPLTKGPSAEEIRRDLELVSKETSGIRTYTTSDGHDRIPALAREYGLRVMPGAWIGSDDARNKREVADLISIVRQNRNVSRVIVGNEALLRAEVTVPEIIDFIRQVQMNASVRVSTAEPWHIWHKHPELVEAVDFIAVQLLPYWEGVPVEMAIEDTLQRYAKLRELYPNKPIVITEVGWPSAGKKVGAAEASLVNQARFIREWVNVARIHQFDYYIIEAFDQPWKIGEEGIVGAYWGLYDADRQPKFSWNQPVSELPDWPLWAAIAVFIGLIPTIVYLRARGELKLPGRAVFAATFQGAGTAITMAMLIPAMRYLGAGEIAAWAVLIMLQVLLFTAVAGDMVELIDVIWRKNRRVQAPRVAGTDMSRLPKVSIHVPCYNEPPEMLKQTLNALAKLDYPNFEVLVIDNNTKDEAVWRPVEIHCQALGDRFRFFHLCPWPGYKAGALNFALKETAGDAEVVAVIDSDYIVTPDWLTNMVPHFQDPAVGLVQAPQDYYDQDESAFKKACYWEYAGFFKIGMVQRNDDNAIIQHGTMTMVRKSALQDVGGWAEWCITEDAELGLRLFQEGWQSVYDSRSYGKGVMPDSLDAYKTQRFRWAYGSVQILKRHWRSLLKPGVTHLTNAQRYHFISGWAPWFADALGMVFTVAAIFWTGMMIAFPKVLEFPSAAFVVPALSVFVFKVLRSLWLYKLRVPCSFAENLGAALGGLALGHMVAKAMLTGIFTSGRPFLRTPKLENRPAWVQVIGQVREEALMLVLLLGAMAAMLLTNHFNQLEERLWLAMLGVLSLPYWAALGMSFINVAPYRALVGMLPWTSTGKTPANQQAK